MRTVLLIGMLLGWNSSADPKLDYNCLVRCQLSHQPLKACEPKCPLKKKGKK